MHVFLTLALLVCSAVATAERAIDKEVTVAAPVAAVWQSWTSKAGIESFFAPQAEIDARVGWGDGGEWDRTYSYFDRAWPRVLANLKKRHESGPIDWTEWLESLKKAHAAPAPK